jgi:hypothetical protein
MVGGQILRDAVGVQLAENGARPVQTFSMRDDKSHFIVFEMPLVAPGRSMVAVKRIHEPNLSDSVRAHRR